jgi:hypothetical protein
MKLREIAVLTELTEAQTVVFYYLGGVTAAQGLVFADRSYLSATTLGESFRDVNARNMFLEFDFPDSANPDEVTAADFLGQVQATHPALRHSLLDLFTIQPQHLSIQERIDSEILVDVRPCLFFSPNRYLTCSLTALPLYCRISAARLPYPLLNRSTKSP